MTTFTIERNGLIFSLRNRDEFEAIFDEVFVQKVYEFKAETASPLVIDAGAHIGVATLFFKKSYPNCRIIAFEPNPQTFQLLKRNIAQNQLRNVQLVPAALGPTDHEVPFYISRDKEEPWTWGDATVKNAWYSKETTKSITVHQVRLSPYLQQSVDFLKLDIEGAETAVLMEAANELASVQQLVLEFHKGGGSSEEELFAILTYLRRGHFSYTLLVNRQVIDEAELPRKDSYVLTVRAHQRDT